MDKFIRLLPSAADYFVRRTYCVMLSLQHKCIFAVVNINNKPAIVITSEKEQKVYFPTNLYYHFSSDCSHALLAYKDDKMWFYEEKFRNGPTICRAGLEVPPKIPWQKFIIK